MAVVLISGRSRMGVRSVRIGQSSGGRGNQGGPCHQRVKFQSSLGDMPLEATSAGLSSVLTYLQQVGGILSVMSATLLAAKAFSFPGAELIQLKTIEESVHESVWMLRSSLTVCKSLLRSRAPQSSNLGMVLGVRGPTLVLAITRETEAVASR